MSDRRIPKYRRHKATGQAVVSLHGRDIYLGRYNTAASRLAYDRLIIEYLSGGHVNADDGLTVTELIAQFWKHVKAYYQKNGQPTTEVREFKRILGIVRKFYGDLPAREFTPLKLKAVRQELMGKGLCRKSINKHISRIRNMFRWATEQELVPPDVLHGLRAVQGLRRGRTTAPDRPPVQPVEESLVTATLPHMPPIVADMVRFQLITGCRPMEVCLIRAMDIDRSGDVWIYRPESHKTEHHGRERVIPIGPTAQGIIAAYLDREPHEYLFSPRESERLRLLDVHRKRRTPISCGNRPGTNRKRGLLKRTPGEHYTTQTYARAIGRACTKANVEHWSPNRLRHTAATRIRQMYGIEGAQIVLGHARADVTQVYAERDLSKALDIARKTG